MNQVNTTVGVIAGTPFDTQLGVARIQQLGLNALPYAISETPEKQTIIQTNRKLLTKKVLFAIKELTKNGATSILIYCNSISLAINYKKLKEIQKYNIYSPIDILQSIKICDPKVGLLAANCQTVGATEKIILSNNKNIAIVGLGCLPLIEAIEENIHPLLLIEQYGLINLCDFFVKNKCKKLILGCTHFEYIYPSLYALLRAKNIPIKLIPVFNLLLERIKNSQP